MYIRNQPFAMDHFEKAEYGRSISQYTCWRNYKTVASLSVEESYKWCINCWYSTSNIRPYTREIIIKSINFAIVFDVVNLVPPSSITVGIE